jgi:Fic family protein
MQVVSGPIGREKVHYQAPEAKRVHGQMQAFLKWFNAPPAIDPVLTAGLAHHWLVTIHPFEDSNDWIVRAIADMDLAHSENSRQRFYSTSAQIHLERKAYYDTLEQTQTEGLDVTPWLEWFLG